jgi:16S rRNA (cytidine1402-2'-O)-methyltransferase
LVVEGFSGESVSDETAELLSLSPEEHVARYESDGLARMDAIKKAAKDRVMSKSELYKILNT